MRKDIWDRYLLQVYYQEKYPQKKGNVSFDYLKENTLNLLYNSLGFKLFRFRFIIELKITKLVEKLKQ